MPEDHKDSTDARPADKAAHGDSTELKWRSGEGRQPYANQGVAEGPEPNLGNEFAEGDRSERSGVNIEQLEQVTKKP